MTLHKKTLSTKSDFVSRRKGELTGVDGELAELENGVVRIARITHGIGASQQHLERDVGNELAHSFQSLPRALVEEPHCHLKTTPSA